MSKLHYLRVIFVSLLLTVTITSLPTITHKKAFSKKVSIETLLANQGSEDPPWWKRIFERNRGGTSRGPGDLCVISPYGEIRYSWSRSPVFVWFDQDNSIKRIALRTQDASITPWVYYPQEPQDSRGLHQVTYDGALLIPQQTYYFEMYTTMDGDNEPETLLHTIPLKLIPEESYIELQSQLDELQLSSVDLSGDQLIEERMRLFANRYYSRANGLIDLTAPQETSEGKGLFLDVVKELFSLQDSDYQELFIESIYAEYCLHDT